IDLYPDINPPYVVVYTSYTGAGPEEVEQSITKILESVLAGVSSLEKMTSTSSKETSMVIMQFTYGTNLIDASNSIRDAIGRIQKYLPTGVDMPVIFRFDPSMMPIMNLTVTGNRSTEELRDIADNTIIPLLTQSPGVATASSSGGRTKCIRVEFDQNRLEAYGINVSQIKGILAAQNVETSAGTIQENSLNYIVTTKGQFTSLDQMRNTVIAYIGGGYVNGQIQQPIRIYLRDVADVIDDYYDATSEVFVNGAPVVMMSVQRQSGTNAVQVAKDLRKKIASLSDTLPPDIKVTELNNSTDQIQRSLNEVTNTAYTGAILAIIVLFIFLRSLKPTLIMGISIPVSIIVTIMFMYFAKQTMNLMTMAGLVLGIGMMVDDSVVVLENIYHYREKGAKLTTAAIIGTQEMLVAVLSSTLTVICVFAPLIAFQGMLEIAGEMFAGLAFTVVISLTISLLSAFFLVPALASHYLPLVTRKQKPLKGVLKSVDDVFARFFEGMNSGYKKITNWILVHKAIVITVILVLFVGSIMLVPKIGYIFMPVQEADNITVNVTCPMGTPLEETQATLLRLQAIAQDKLKGAYVNLVTNAGTSGGMAGRMGGSNSNTGSLRISLPKNYKDRPMNNDQIKTALRPSFSQFPGTIITFGSSYGAMGMGSPVDIVVRTNDLVKGKSIADRIAALLRAQVPDVTEPTVSLNDGLPQVELVLDREKMYSLGLDTYTVGNEIQAAVNGVVATQYQENGENYDVLLIYRKEDRMTRLDLDHIFVTSQLAGRIPISSFVSYNLGTGPLSISRENQSRVIHVTADARPGAKLNTLQTRIQTLVSANIAIDNDVVITYEGDNEQMMTMITRFILIVAVAIFLVFGVMAALFESFRDPFIIIFCLPLSFIGIIAIHLITGHIFNMLTAVGLLVLIGVIVKNGIIMVDYANLLRKRGLSLHDAIVEAAGNRLRPILMTTLTSVLALAPMAFAPGEGAEFTGPIGETVFGGLTFGTLMTLFLMPAIYYIINQGSDRRQARAIARRERIAMGLSRKDYDMLIKKQAAAGTDKEISGNAPVQSLSEEANI
ncbi:MAG: efflux RND transporter permease subunit, partial [Treponema sp.]|nr:efflux RND transporter permease subunit [Treponema sp.]